MSTLKNKLVDKISVIPEQVSANLYRSGRSFYLVSSCGVTVKNTERGRNAVKLKWDDTLDAFDWANILLDSEDPNAKKIAAVAVALEREEEGRIVSGSTAPNAMVVTSAHWTDSGYGVAVHYEEGYYHIFDYYAGDTWMAGTVEGVLERIRWITRLSLAQVFAEENFEKGGV